MPRTVLFFLLAFPAVSMAQPAEPVNLVANGDFSRAAGGKPEKWATAGSPVNVTQTLSVEKDADGKPFARLVCTRCERQGGDSHAMLAQNGQVNLIQGPPVSVLVPDAGHGVGEPHDQRCDPGDQGLAP